MLFQITHRHTNETCPAQGPEQMKRLGEWWEKLRNQPGVRVLAGYVSVMDHTFHITVEADDYPALAKALGPLNTLGEGQTTPVLTLDQAFPMAESGAFRMS